MSRAYLFDFDGTLADSMPTFAGVMLRILDEHAIPYGDDIVRIITPLGYQGTAEYFRTLGISATVEELMDTMNRYACAEYERSIPACRTSWCLRTERSRRWQGICGRSPMTCAGLRRDRAVGWARSVFPKTSRARRSCPGR